MDEDLNRPPLWRLMMGNAFLLSTVYLTGGVIIEALRRFRPAPWVLDLSTVLDRLPGRVLELLGLLGRLREAYEAQLVSEFALRAAFAATMVVIIFALAIAVGLATWSVRRLFELRATRPERGRDR